MRERLLKWRAMGNTRGRGAIKARESLNLLRVLHTGQPLSVA